ncbi:hypothetical protein H9W57_001059 [Campylobacter jejuni]|uniref:hypothetical protein n=1 Tax=Campylobacter jejuni TaxID=197 RepID=UPI0017BEB36C|nr:hypothetical protein [Campylobacter jejuni]EDO9415784.1 hypothetical protein [Campylobacter coli]EFB5611680.1 hypothetical protein [Campylobacter jejuni]EFS5454573.1 hypothetical protein [Campylobacter coli]EGC6704064.1 hypothetical protein [Campylobacter jejuni]EGC9795994.1 hypothetical protein [Campylobacter coli]
MLDLVIFGIFALVFFVAGVLVANNNKAKTDKIVNELKEKLENLENKAKGE